MGAVRRRRGGGGGGPAALPCVAGYATDTGENYVNRNFNDITNPAHFNPIRLFETVQFRDEGTFEVPNNYETRVLAAGRYLILAQATLYFNKTGRTNSRPAVRMLRQRGANRIFLTGPDNMEPEDTDNAGNYSVILSCLADLQARDEVGIGVCSNPAGRWNNANNSINLAQNRDRPAWASVVKIA